MKKHTLTIDFMRGIAAPLVLFQHSFNLLFSIPNNVASMTDSHLWYRIISIPTSFGRTAVVVFFVISGYLVGHDVWVRINNNTFSPKFYTISRLSRLYCVVLPVKRLPKWLCKPYMVWNVFLMAVVLRVANADYFIQNLSVATLVMFAIYYREHLDNLLFKCPQGVKTVIMQLSNYSFSLYFIHLPLLFALCSFVPLFGGKLAYNAQYALKYIAVLIMVNGMAFGFYGLFERRYLVLRNFCMRLAGG